MELVKIRYWFESTNHIYYENITVKELKSLIEEDTKACNKENIEPCYEWDIFAITDKNEKPIMGI